MSSLGSQTVLNASNMKMPILGFGTWQGSNADNEKVECGVDAALNAGYRHIDTAHMYGIEEGVGNALKKWFDSGKLKREDVFIVTKCSPVFFRPQHIERSLDESLKKLQLDYVDLYLAHTPTGLQFNESFALNSGKWEVDMNTDILANWKAMEDLVEKGKAKAIGISNFNINQIQRILDVCRIKPANLQVELYVYLQQPELIKFCKDNGITVCAYSPIGSPALKEFTVSKNEHVSLSLFHSPMEDPVVVEIAKKHGKTPAQVLIRFLLQCGVAAIPKSVNPERIKQNINVFDFELSKDDMDKLKTLDKGEAGRQFTGSEGGVISDFLEHPEYPYPR